MDQGLGPWAEGGLGGLQQGLDQDSGLWADGGLGALQRGVDQGLGLGMREAPIKGWIKKGRVSGASKPRNPNRMTWLMLAKNHYPQQNPHVARGVGEAWWGGGFRR